MRFPTTINKLVLSSTLMIASVNIIAPVPTAMASPYTSLASSVYLHHPCGCGEEDGTCNDSTFTPDESKYYTIQHWVDEDQYWTYQSSDESFLINPGGNVDITSDYSATETHWRFVEDTSNPGYYYIRSRLSGQALGIDSNDNSIISSDPNDETNEAVSFTFSCVSYDSTDDYYAFVAQIEDTDGFINHDDYVANEPWLIEEVQSYTRDHLGDLTGQTVSFAVDDTLFEGGISADLSSAISTYGTLFSGAMAVTMGNPIAGALANVIWAQTVGEGITSLFGETITMEELSNEILAVAETITAYGIAYDNYEEFVTVQDNTWEYFLGDYLSIKHEYSDIGDQTYSGETSHDMIYAEMLTLKEWAYDLNLAIDSMYGWVDDSTDEKDVYVLRLSFDHLILSVTQELAIWQELILLLGFLYEENACAFLSAQYLDTDEIIDSRKDLLSQAMEVFIEWKTTIDIEEGSWSLDTISGSSSGCNLYDNSLESYIYKGGDDDCAAVWAAYNEELEFDFRSLSYNYDDLTDLLDSIYDQTTENCGYVQDDLDFRATFALDDEDATGQCNYDLDWTTGELQKCFGDVDCCNGYECGDSHNCEYTGTLWVDLDEDLETEEFVSIIPVGVTSDTTVIKVENIGTGKRLIRGPSLDVYAREYESGLVEKNQRWYFEAVEGAEEGYYYVKNKRHEVYMKMGDEVGNSYTWEVESSDTIPEDDDSSYRWYVRDISDDQDGSIVEIYHTSDSHLTRYVLGTYDSDDGNVALCYQEVVDGSAYAEYTKFCMATDDELSWYLI